MGLIRSSSSAALVWVMVLVSFALPATAVVTQNQAASPPFPPPGKLVDVGGWRLHLNCTGEARASQPTVILEAGVSDFSVEWGLVQPGVAQFARVCSYDRAGDGWSDLGPHPRTLRQIVVGHIAAAVNPFENEELAGLRAELAKREHPLGDMPLIVLTRGISEEEGPDGKAFEAEHRRGHAAMAAMSRNGKLIVATRSGHHVQLDEPELVVKAIRDTLAATRK